MAEHARLKNEFTEDGKCHNLMAQMLRFLMIWAATWQNQQSDCAPSEDSDQPGHPPSLIRVFAVRMKKACVLSYPLSAQWTLMRLGGCPGWPESSLGAQSLCWFCHVAAHLSLPMPGLFVAANVPTVVRIKLSTKVRNRKSCLLSHKI